MADVAPQGEVQQATPEQRLSAYLGVSPAPQQAAPEPELSAPEQAEDVEGVEQLASADNAEAQPSTDEEPYEELEHLGKTYEVPVSLKKAFEENRANFTKATTEAKAIAALQQQVATRAQLVEAEAQFAKYAEPEANQKARLEAVLAEYKKLDWYNMSPEQYSEQRKNRDLVAEQLEDAKAALQAKRQEFEGWRTQRSQEMLRHGQEYLNKVIPNFQAEETRLRIAQTAMQMGYTNEEVASMSDPRLVVALHKAAQWDRLQASKPSVQNKVAKAAPRVRTSAPQGQSQAAVEKEKSLRARLKQSGDYRDAAALLAARLAR